MEKCGYRSVIACSIRGFFCSMDVNLTPPRWAVEIRNPENAAALLCVRRSRSQGQRNQSKNGAERASSSFRRVCERPHCISLPPETGEQYHAKRTGKMMQRRSPGLRNGGRTGSSKQVDNRPVNGQTSTAYRERA
jgi:hypothetical protein